MNKRFIPAVVLLVILGAVAGLALKWWLARDATLPPTTDKELLALSRNLKNPPAPAATPVVPIPPTQTVRLAIGSLGLADESQNGQLADLLTADLGSATGLQLIERASLDRILHELQLSLSRLVRAKDAVRAGKLLKADWFLLGTPAVVNGTNVLVVRIVDAQTGVMRDAGMIPQSTSSAAMSSSLATFVRHARQDAVHPRVKTYLAIGVFTDLSLNSRQASLPGELRSYLTAAYQGGGDVTMLEREFVATLLQELNLDLAGLTESSGAESPRPMQAAYWMVHGFYQSFETTNFQVELALDVRQMFGRNQRLQLRDKPGEPLFRSVKSSIDRVMQQNRSPVLFTRVTELKSQLDAGKELVKEAVSTPFMNFSLTRPETYADWPDNELARRRRNIDEAIRALQTALLLDPTNREARIYMAACFQLNMVGRMEEARDIYRGLIESPVEDKWSDIAREALLRSFDWQDPEIRRQWFLEAAQQNAKPAAVEFFRRSAKRAADDVALRRGDTNAFLLAESRLFAAIQSFNGAVLGNGGTISQDIGMDDFQRALGNDRPLVARRLAELFPKIKARFPASAPYVLASIVTFQVDTNAPIIAEYQRALDLATEPTNSMVLLSGHIRNGTYHWALKYHANDLAIKILETALRLQKQKANGRPVERDDEATVSLAYAYLASERWKEALGIFESYTNRPVYMGNSGPWGDAFSIVLTSKQAAFCRQKLSMPPVVDSREFDLGEPCLHLHPGMESRKTPSENTALGVGSDGLWLGTANYMVHLDFDLHTNFSVAMPTAMHEIGPITSISIGETNVWIGTSGAGLFELDKSTHTTRRLTEKDGLLMDYISDLRQVGNTLWIAYGNEANGGLGRLDLTTRRFASFTAPLSDVNEASRNPPRSRVDGIRMGSDGRLWFLTRSRIRNYSVAADTWAGLPSPPHSGWVTAFALNSDCLLQAVMSYSPSARGTPDTGILERVDLKDLQTRRLLGSEGLPNLPTNLALNGKSLWVGGRGFLALVDLDANKITKLAYIPGRGVDRMEFGGGYLWVQFDRHVYRTRL